MTDKKKIGQEVKRRLKKGQLCPLLGSGNRFEA
jgi:hypothetical protein